MHKSESCQRLGVSAVFNVRATRDKARAPSEDDELGSDHELLRLASYLSQAKSAETLAAQLWASDNESPPRLRASQPTCELWLAILALLSKVHLSPVVEFTPLTGTVSGRCKSGGATLARKLSFALSCHRLAIPLRHSSSRHRGVFQNQLHHLPQWCRYLVDVLTPEASWWCQHNQDAVLDRLYELGQSAQSADHGGSENSEISCRRIKGSLQALRARDPARWHRSRAEEATKLARLRYALYGNEIRLEGAQKVTWAPFRPRHRA